mmetsp:Transcript_19277/g.56224  ORF Transcript_19277/g.56224 Transcript_19277/m.56224 type:complete len:200 (+) Transcript_19277:1935-2534(+)
MEGTVSGIGRIQEEERRIAQDAGEARVHAFEVVVHHPTCHLLQDQAGRQGVRLQRGAYQPPPRDRIPIGHATHVGRSIRGIPSASSTLRSLPSGYVPRGQVSQEFTALGRRSTGVLQEEEGGEASSRIERGEDMHVRFDRILLDEMLVRGGGGVQGYREEGLHRGRREGTDGGGKEDNARDDGRRDCGSGGRRRRRRRR